jgi:hypothetical protein
MDGVSRDGVGKRCNATAPRLEIPQPVDVPLVARGRASRCCTFVRRRWGCWTGTLTLDPFFCKIRHSFDVRPFVQGRASRCLTFVRRRWGWWTVIIIVDPLFRQQRRRGRIPLWGGGGSIVCRGGTSVFRGGTSGSTVWVCRWWACLFPPRRRVERCSSETRLGGRSCVGIRRRIVRWSRRARFHV